MTIEKILYDVGKPEEKTAIGLEGDGWKNVLAAFDIWAQLLMRGENLTLLSLNNYDVQDRLLNEASSMLAGLQLPYKIEPKQLCMLQARVCMDYKLFIGLFCTALLNNGVEELIIPKDIEISACGYKLKRGVIRNYSGPNHWRNRFGECMEGGCIINFGNISCLAHEAVDGIVINRGIIFSHSPITSDFAINAIGGFFIDIGSCSHNPPLFDNDSSIKGGILVMYEDYVVKIYVPEAAAKVIHVNPEKETPLIKMLQDIRSASEKPDIPRLQKLRGELRSLCTKI